MSVIPPRELYDVFLKGEYHSINEMVSILKYYDGVN